MPNATIARMDECKLSRLSVEFGGFPEKGESLEMTMDISVSNRKPLEDGRTAMAIDFLLYSNSGKFYLIDAQAIGKFSIPSSGDENRAGDYLRSNGANEMYAAIRVMLDSVTSCFSAGTINIPPADIALG